jgi:hypothetical protein
MRIENKNLEGQRQLALDRREPCLTSCTCAEEQLSTSTIYPPERRVVCRLGVFCSKAWSTDCATSVKAFIVQMDKLTMRKPSPDIHFLVPGMRTGKPDFQISILENLTSQYPSWTIGHPDSHSVKKTTRVPNSTSGVPITSFWTFVL